MLRWGTFDDMVSGAIRIEWLQAQWLLDGIRRAFSGWSGVYREVDTRHKHRSWVSTYDASVLK